MTDQQDPLRDHLKKLEAELQRTQPADETQRQHLDALHSDVRSLLAKPEPLTPEDHQSLGQRLRASLQHFETTHPALSALIEQVLNTLSAAGI
jgi:Domain of unknown function (DUF4404)